MSNIDLHCFQNCRPLLESIFWLHCEQDYACGSWYECITAICIYFLSSSLIVSIILPDRHWNEQMLDEACRLVLKEIALPGSASGEKVDYKKTLIVSFFYRFFLEVLQSLKTMVN